MEEIEKHALSCTNMHFFVRRFIEQNIFGFLINKIYYYFNNFDRVVGIDLKGPSTVGTPGMSHSVAHSASFLIISDYMKFDIFYLSINNNNNFMFGCYRRWKRRTLTLHECMQRTRSVRRMNLSTI